MAGGIDRVVGAFLGRQHVITDHSSNTFNHRHELSMTQSESFTVTGEQAANFDHCVAEIENSLPPAGAAINVCEVYRHIKPYLDRAIAIIRDFGPLGKRVADALSALRRVLEAACPESAESIANAHVPSASTVESGKSE